MGGFEFGFVDPPSEARPETPAPQVPPPIESIQGAIPFPQTNGAAEPATGFAVPSLFSGSGQDQVLDFKQVEAPEAPALSNEVSFDLSSVPEESAAPVAETQSAPSTDGKYFDLIPEEKPAAAAVKESVESSDQSVDLAVGPSSESGFDIASLAGPADRGTSTAEEEPLGDVFSQDKRADASGQETAFAITEEKVTVDVRPPASESFRMVLPPSQEGGTWPELESEQSGGILTSLAETKAFESTASPGTSPRSDPTVHASPERSFTISEAEAPASPFDPMELRADEPTEAATTTPLQPELRNEPAEGFTSSLMWAQEPPAQPPSAEAAESEGSPAEVIVPAAGVLEQGAVNQWPDAQGTISEAGGNEVVSRVEAPPAVDLFESPLGPIDLPDGPQPEGSLATGEVKLSPEMMDDIVRRVIREMSDSVIRELAWEILPDCVERVVEKLSRESLAKKL